MTEKSIDDLLKELADRWTAREAGYGGQAIKKLCLERDELRAALKRLGSMEAFYMPTVHVPTEAKMRIDYARTELKRISGIE